ncbi:MAG: CYTH domain-containing protein, partial [Clostridiaceae bacterium]|jgi:uncharacterized protein YjbK|nr:CYTH domain-containing protein [Clostridiaceae bacterium]
MKQIENELKILITENTYRHLAKLANDKGGITVVQTNYYFDTADFFMYRHKKALRIREKNQKYVLTLKAGRRKDGSYQTSDEYSYPLTEDQAKDVLSGRLPLLSCFPDSTAKEFLPKDNALIFRGYMTTKRTLFAPVPNLRPLEIDQNDYLGFRDYELEWEFEKEEDRFFILPLLKDFGIDPLFLPSRSKFGRFMERLIAQKEQTLPRDNRNKFSTKKETG